MMESWQFIVQEASKAVITLHCWPFKGACVMDANRTELWPMCKPETKSYG